MTDARILIVGGTSLDTLHGVEELVAGGAGMYTAMASWHSGASVTLFAPKPDPMPEPLRPVAESVAWLGPTVSATDLPRFEIVYTAGKANYVQASFGAEVTLSPSALPDDLSVFDYVHIVPLGDLRQQYEFMLACRKKGASQISAGTVIDLINGQPNLAHTVLEAADLFFMNEEEALRLFGSMAAVRSGPGQTLFVTQGKQGATVVQGEVATALDGHEANVVDPTGAGDTFCGATLVGLARGLHPAMAARKAMPLAAQMTEGIGPAELLLKSENRSVPSRKSVVVNAARVRKMASLIAELEDVTPFDFTGPDLPAADHPAALDYFFASVLQQFGFWNTANGKYDHPLIATIDGEERKGAFYVFRAYLRWLEDAPERLTPEAQANLTRADLLELLRADDSSDPLPAFELHLGLAQQYGRDMLALGLTPHTLLEQVRASRTPLRALLQKLDHIGGYKEDPLRKKSGLLAIILRQRPEAFLLQADEEVPPVVDYHVMRTCLRTGLIDVNDKVLADQLIGRDLLAEEDEWAVRHAAYDAIKQIVAESGKSMGAVDWFFFKSRERCPEMSEPLCEKCAINPVCAHRKELFQPVRRTTFY